VVTKEVVALVKHHRILKLGCQVNLCWRAEDGEAVSHLWCRCFRDTWKTGQQQASYRSAG